jgi:hypothetical protein
MVATPSLAALRQRDLDAEKAARDPSDLNFGPLCGCQDDEGMHVVGVIIHQARPRRASATVTLGFTAQQTVLQMDLVAVGREWRIDNIRGRAGPYPWNLRTVLRRSIAGHGTAAR